MTVNGQQIILPDNTVVIMPAAILTVYDIFHMASADRLASNLANQESGLALHDIKEGEPYYLGIFLTGAYQDIMGDIHNLFGRVNEVHVFLDDDEECGYEPAHDPRNAPLSRCQASPLIPFRSTVAPHPCALLSTPRAGLCS